MRRVHLPAEFPVPVRADGRPRGAERSVRPQGGRVARRTGMEVPGRVNEVRYAAVCSGRTRTRVPSDPVVTTGVDEARHPTGLRLIPPHRGVGCDRPGGQSLVGHTLVEHHLVGHDGTGGTLLGCCEVHGVLAGSAGNCRGRDVEQQFTRCGNGGVEIRRAIELVGHRIVENGAVDVHLVDDDRRRIQAGSRRPCLLEGRREVDRCSGDEPAAVDRRRHRHGQPM